MAKYVREEVVLALDLYMRIPSSAININNIEIIRLSDFVSKYYNSHSVGSIKILLENFKSVNPVYTSANRVGMSHASKITRDVWNEFYSKGFNGLHDEAERIISEKTGITNGESMLDDVLPEMYTSELANIPPGYMREYISKVRVNQDVFRSAVLASFNNRCCITGIGNESILRASHIKPWRACSAQEKTDPSNGLCLNPLHDLAFDKGLISIDKDLEIVLSPKIDKYLNAETIKNEFQVYEGKQISLPDKVEIKEEFIQYHNEKILIA